MERNYALVNGLKLYYEIHRETRNSNPPLVLLHGGGSTIETSFGAILPMLAKNRTCVAFDQQGHGRTSDIADRPFSFHQSADDTVFKGWIPAEIKSIQAPTLILMGDRDVALPEHAVLMFRLTPNSQLCILPGTDHAKIVSSSLVPLIVETFLNTTRAEL